MLVAEREVATTFDGTEGARESEHAAVAPTTDAGEDRLVHQHLADADLAAPQTRPRHLGVGVASERVGPQSGGDGIGRVGLQDLARGRTDQVDAHVVVGRHPPADVRPAGRPVEEVAEDPEVDVEHLARGPLVEEVLAVGIDPLEHGPVDPPGGVDGAALRRRHPQRAPTEATAVVAGDQVERVSFGQRGDTF